MLRGNSCGKKLRKTGRAAIFRRSLSVPSKPAVTSVWFMVRDRYLLSFERNMKVIYVRDMSDSCHVFFMAGFWNQQESHLSMHWGIGFVMDAPQLHDLARIVE